MRGVTGAVRAAAVESVLMQSERRRASLGDTINYGLIVGVVWSFNVWLMDVPFDLIMLPILMGWAAAAAVACEQGVSRLQGAWLLLAVAVIPGVTLAAAASRAPSVPINLMIVVACAIAPVVVARCLADMFLRTAGDGKRRVLTAIVVPALVLAAYALAGARVPRSDWRPIATTAVLGLAAVPPVPRGRSA